MANATTHADHALRYRAVADTLRASSPVSAGEIMWLALVQAAQANEHRHSTATHTQSRKGIRNVVGRLPVSQREKAALLDISNMSATNLHGLAYRPADIDDRRHRAHISRASHLVEVLLRHA